MNEIYYGLDLDSVSLEDCLYLYYVGIRVNIEDGRITGFIREELF